jgi:predicted nucleic acid-binding Zn ribbon protein
MARRYRSAAAREQDPTPIRAVLNQVVERDGWGPHIALGRLQSVWPQIVGEQVAARSEPVKLADGRLTIRVEPGAWAAELALLGPSLATAAAGFLGPDLVQEVAVVAGTLSRAQRHA